MTRRRWWMPILLAPSVLVGLTIAATHAHAALPKEVLQYKGYGPRSTAVSVWDLYGDSCVSTTCQIVGLTVQGTGFAAGSTDGGRHWTQERLPSTAARLADVSCTSKLVCMSVGESASSAPLAVATTNGGRTWQLHMLPGGKAYMSNISCAAATTCVAIGNLTTRGAMAVATQNGGTTWSRHVLPPSVDRVDQLSCPTVTVCEAIATPSGAGAFALRTLNGGTSWTVKRLHESSGPDLSCPSVTTCFALGRPVITSSLSTVLRTVNGGATWSSHTVGALLVDWSIDCISARTCVAIGGGRTATIALRTSDAASTWSAPAPIPGGLQDVWKLSCTSTTFCLGVGDYSTAPHSLSGETIRTVNGGISWSDYKFP